LAAALGCVSLLIAYRITLPDWLTVWSSGHGEDPARVPGFDEERIAQSDKLGLARLVSNWRKLAAVVVVVGAIVALLGSSYLLPLSRLEVHVDNMNQESMAQVTIHLDGREIKSGFASSDAYLTTVVSATTGTHTVSIDYGWLGKNQSAIDGVPDWYSDVITKPFQRSYIGIVIGFHGWNQPILQTVNEQIPQGQKISVESVTQILMGSTVRDSLNWGDVSIILTDGSSSVKWQPNTADLINMTGGIARHDFPAEDMGALTVLCNVTDLMSNGYADPGDFFTIVTMGGNGFSSQTTYALYVMFEPTSSLLAEIDFQGA
jgi:hypothetical protein